MKRFWFRLFVEAYQRYARFMIDLLAGFEAKSRQRVSHITFRLEHEQNHRVCKMLVEQLQRELRSLHDVKSAEISLRRQADRLTSLK